MYTDLLRLSIKYISSIYAARASQSSAVRRRRKKIKIVFSDGMYVGKHSAQAASVYPKGARAAACIPSKKCLHF